MNKTSGAYGFAGVVAHRVRLSVTEAHKPKPKAIAKTKAKKV